MREEHGGEDSRGSFALIDATSKILLTPEMTKSSLIFFVSYILHLGLKVKKKKKTIYKKEISYLL